jgi:outer membrane protein
MPLVAGALRRWVAYGVVAALATSHSGAHADTLPGALIQTYTCNPQLNSQRAVVRATDEGVPQALSGYKPRITATMSTGQQYATGVSRTTESSTFIGTGSPLVGASTYPRVGAGFTPSTVNVTANQTVYNGMQTANRTRQAESNTSIARETLRVTEQTILLNAATVYMDLLRDTALLDLQRRNVEVLQEQLRQTRDRFIVGEVTRTDVAQAETNLAAGRAQVLVAEANFARSKATYRQVVCVDAGTLAPGAPVDRLLPPKLPLAVQIARARHPSVGVAMFGIDFALLQVKINEGSLYPTATITGTVQQQWESDLTKQALQQFNAFVLGQLSVPIYQGGQEYSLIRQAKETVGQKRIDLDTARDAAQANVITQWAQLEAAKASIYATQTQVASAEIALNGVREEARVGQRTTLDVLNAIIALVNARTALVTAQHDRVVASYSTLAGVGELNLPKLGLNIPLYDPVVHYQQVRDAWAGVRNPDGR